MVRRYAPGPKLTTVFQQRTVEHLHYGTPELTGSRRYERR